MHKDNEDSAIREALAAHNIRAEAMRAAETKVGGSSLEAKLAAISARVTAEAHERHAAASGDGATHGHSMQPTGT